MLLKYKVVKYCAYEFGVLLLSAFNNGPHYRFCPCVTYGFLTEKQKGRRMTKIGLNFFQGRSDWCASFSSEGQRVKGQG